MFLFSIDMIAESQVFHSFITMVKIFVIIAMLIIMNVIIIVLVIIISTLCSPQKQSSISFTAVPTPVIVIVITVVLNNVIINLIIIIISAVCSPSRASLMTGRHPQSVGLYPGVLFADSLQGHPGHDGDEGDDDAADEADDGDDRYEGDDDGQSIGLCPGVIFGQGHRGHGGDEGHDHVLKDVWCLGQGKAINSQQYFLEFCQSELCGELFCEL